MDSPARTPARPCTNVAALQAQIREYVAIMTRLKQRREETREMNAELQRHADDIMHTMQENNIPSCFSMGYTFTVKSKLKMRSATARSFLQEVKTFFRLSDDVMDQFVDHVNARRERDGREIVTLECKVAKQPAVAAGAKPTATTATTSTDTSAAAASAAAAGGGSASSLSGAIDDMYS